MYGVKKLNAALLIEAGGERLRAGQCSGIIRVLLVNNG
jgi:hypothetical protein